MAARGPATGCATGTPWGAADWPKGEGFGWVEAVPPKGFEAADEANPNGDACCCCGWPKGDEFGWEG
jgi:hypothetical protein